MVDRPPFPIPQNVNPEEYRCITIPVPDDPTYLQVFVGVISDMTQWFNWARDEGKNGKECAQVWRDIYNEIDWSGNMSKCGCNCVPQRFRFTADGGYQVSNDGGVTWVDAPEYDYRNTSVIFPTLEDQGITSTKCQAADSVVATYRDQIVQNMNDTDTASAILAIVATALLIFLTAGTGLIVGGIIGLGGAIVSFGVAATQAAFTSTVWDDFRCLVYNRMDSDDSIDEISFKALIQDVHDTFEGIVNIVLTNLLNATGTVGLTNIMRSNAGDPDADCSGCDEGCDNPSPTVPTGGGTVNEVDGRFINITSQFDGGQQAVYLWFDNTTEIFDPDKCGRVVYESITGMDSITKFYNECGTGTLVESPFTNDTCAAQFVWRSVSTFTIALETCTCPP